MARYFLVLCYNNIWVLCYQLEKILSYILLKDKTIEHYQMTPLYIYIFPYPDYIEEPEWECVKSESTAELLLPSFSNLPDMVTESM